MQMESKVININVLNWLNDANLHLFCSWHREWGACVGGFWGEGRGARDLQLENWSNYIYTCSYAALYFLGPRWQPVSFSQKT